MKIDAKETLVQAEKIKKALTNSTLGLTDSDIKTTQNKDGYVEFVILNNKLPDNSEVDGATAKNIDKVIDPFYKEWRGKGWYFDQRVGGTFAIGVKASLNESFTFAQFLSEQTQ